MRNLGYCAGENRTVHASSMNMKISFDFTSSSTYLASGTGMCLYFLNFWACAAAAVTETGIVVEIVEKCSHARLRLYSCSFASGAVAALPSGSFKPSYLRSYHHGLGGLRETASPPAGPLFTEALIYILPPRILRSCHCHRRIQCSTVLMNRQPGVKRWRW